MGKVVCEKHEEAYDENKSCPYCEDTDENKKECLSQEDLDNELLHDLYGFYTGY